MRADAERNRRELLRAARALFVERGVDVALDGVAQRAGVSIATLYRNFADRAELVRAVAADGMASVRDAARLANESFADDPARAWRDFAGTVVALQAGAIMPVLQPVLRSLDADPELARVRTEAFRAVDDLVAAAQRHGQVRTDISATEIVLLIMTVARPLPALPEEHVDAFVERALHVTLAGLRPGAGPPLPGEPVRLSADPR